MVQMFSYVLIFLFLDVYSHNTPVTLEILRTIYIIFPNLPRQTENRTCINSQTRPSFRIHASAQVHGV